jgi:hypothetical protein
MGKKLLIILMVVTPFFIGLMVQESPSQSWKEKLQKNIKERNKKGGSKSVQDGCLHRKLTVRQASLGSGKWSAPQFIPDLGFQNGNYRFITCEMWKGSHNLSSAMKKSNIKIRQLQAGCGRSYPHLDKSADIYVQTAENADWNVYKKNILILYTEKWL